MNLQAKKLTDEDVQRFVADGYLNLRCDLPDEIHGEIDSRLREVAEHESWHGNNIVARVPLLHQVLRCSVVQGAVASLLGDDFLVHPHRAIHRSTPVNGERMTLSDEADAPPMGKGSTAGSAWHQDAQSPLARARHHAPRFLIGFYFPHDTPRQMGPTRLQAGSHLWPHPLKEPLGVVVPDMIPAGTFMLVHFDMVHAGFSNFSNQARYMVKFVFSRMSNPVRPNWDSRGDAWLQQGYQTPIELPDAWRHLWNWLRGAAITHDVPGATADLESDDPVVALSAIYRRYDSADLGDRLRSVIGKGLHQRKLVAQQNGRRVVRDDIKGYPRRWNERAIVLENATYALIAQGPSAVSVLLDLLSERDPWLDVNIAFALGEIGHESESVLSALEKLLQSEHHQVVRQAVDAIAFLQPDATRFLPQFDRLMRERKTGWQSKEVERGWCATDQVRLNIAFACVALLNTPTDRDALQDLLCRALMDQGYAAQVAVEGLRRLGTAEAMAAALNYAVDRSWDDTLLGMVKGY